MIRFGIRRFCLSVALAASTSVAGEPGGSLSGKVTDALSGNPIEGALVRITARTDRVQMLPDSMYTDASGAYTFSGLAPIEGKGFGYILIVSRPEYHLSVTDPLINLDSGEAKILDFALQPHLSLHIRVADADDSAGGLAGAGLVASLAGDGSPYRELQSDSGGWFRLQNAPKTTLELTLTMAGYRTRVVRKMVDGFRREDTLRVAMRRDEPATAKTVSGTVKDTKGMPMQVQFYFNCPAGDGTAWFMPVSQEDGTYIIPGIPAECDSGAFHLAGTHDVDVVLDGSETRMDLTYPDPLGVRKAGPAGRWTPRPPAFRGRDILGRSRLPANAGPARPRP